MKNFIQTAVLLQGVLAMSVFVSGDAQAGTVAESARRIPVAGEADVVVVGGSSGAVAAACAAAAKGASVFLVAPRPYLGEDLAGTLRLWLEEGEEPASALGKRLFPKETPPLPLHVKKTFDDALLEADVRFLTGCYATGVLRDDAGNIAGVVISDRAGRQAIRAKVIVDATDRAWTARLAGARFEPYPAGKRAFSRVVVGGEPEKGPGLVSCTARSTLKVRRQREAKFQGEPTAWECALELEMKDGSFASFAEAEQAARGLTWHAEQLDAADSLFQVPPDPVKAETAFTGAWPGASRVDVNVFRPAGVKRLWIVGGCAAVSREAAARLLRPLELIDAGTRVGEAAAAEAKSLPAPANARLPGTKPGAGSAQAGGDVREGLLGLRELGLAEEFVPSEAQEVPVLGRYDVVVVGGGTAGAPAGIGAARQKAKTLVAEYLHALGGVGTVGMIGSYYHGNKVGFTLEHDASVERLGAAVYVVGKAECWRRDNRQTGAEIWFGTLGCGVLVEGARVRGVVVATPEGRGVVLAGAVVDATGNSDVAAAAGAECMDVGSDEIALQGTGLSPRDLGVSNRNSDYSFARDSDVLDVWQFNLLARRRYEKGYDTSQIVNSRERRRIVGDFVLSPTDVLNRRTLPDTVVVTKSNFDSHGYTVHTRYLTAPPPGGDLFAYVPYRCLLPKSVDGLLVAGIGLSVHRDALPIVRMQRDVQNQGYAAGVAAAMAARSDLSPRAIDVKALQQHLVETRNIPAEALNWKDSYPLPDERLAAAARALGDSYEGLEVLLSDPARSLPLLRAEFQKAVGEKQLVYAHVLGMLADPAGAECLAAAVGSAPWDEGWDFKGMGQYGGSVSRLDSLIIAMGRTRDKRALAPILDKVKQLDAGSAFSHHRAIALALESIDDQAAAAPLAELLSKPGMTGYSVQTVEPQGKDSGAGGQQKRSETLRELALARALFRCGDHNGVAEEILKRYEKDLRGPYARHAHFLLAEKGR